MSRRFVGIAAAFVLAGALLAAPGCSLALQRSNGGIAFLEDQRSMPVRTAARAGKYLGWILASPLVVAMVPLSLLAWATPWVDLPTAVDIASAPALGLGYATEAAAGFPVYGALRLVQGGAEGGSPQRRYGPVKASGRWKPRRSGAPWGLVLAHRPAPAQPRAPLPVPADVAAYYTPPPSAVRTISRALERAISVRGCGPAALRLGGATPAKVEVHFASEGGPRPLVLLTPPNRVTSAARYLASWFASRGTHAVVIVPEREFLEPGLTPAQVEAKLRGAVVGSRAVLAALARRPEVDASHLAYMGISAGGIFGAVLVATEPAIARAVLWLPGGDLPRIVAESVDREVRAYRESWEERGVTPSELAARLRRHVRTDPLALAPHVDPSKLLIALGGQDLSVPTDVGLALHEAMGRPEGYMLAGRHASAVIPSFGFLLRTSEEFLLR